MALDLSNIGPGSVTKSTKSRAQIRAELAAKKKRLNAGGPGTAGYTPPNMIRPVEVSPPLSSRGYAGSNNVGLAPLPVRQDTFAGLQFANVDTMLFKDRLSGARAWYDTQGMAFKQTTEEREQMIRDDDYRRDQLAQDLLLKKYELELKYGTQISTAEIDARQAMDREAMHQQTALVQSAVQAANQVQAPPVEQLPPINLIGMVQ